MKVGIYIFNEVEVLDFAGPFEVFSLAEKDGTKLFDVCTIGDTCEMISARNGLKVVPDYTIENMPYVDILIIPGGYGAEHLEIKKKHVIHWIKDQYSKVVLLASVCTGAFLLAEADVLDGKKATTHWVDLDRLEKEYILIDVLRDTKFVDEGDVITSGGISAGINMSFHIVVRYFGMDIALDTAKRMEYDLIG